MGLYYVILLACAAEWCCRLRCGGFFSQFLHELRFTTTHGSQASCWLCDGWEHMFKRRESLKRALLGRLGDRRLFNPNNLSTLYQMSKPSSLLHSHHPLIMSLGLFSYFRVSHDKPLSG